MHCLSGKLVRCSILVLASLTVCLSLVSYGKPASRGGRKSTQPEKVLRIRIPKEVDPEELTILEGVYANGLYCGPVDMKKGVHEYTRKLSAQTTSVKLLVYHPAYKMVAAEITAKEATLKKPFTPKFVPRPMVPLTAKFADTKGKPIAGREVALTLYLGEMEYFGYVDGTVFPQRVATATTDAAGEIHVSVPSLLDDPYFAKQERRKPGFGAELPCPEQDKGFGWFSVPYGIPAQRSYPEPVTLTMTYYGKISARISRSFLTKCGVPASALKPSGGAATSIFLLAMNKNKGSGSLHALSKHGDATISSLPPGAYEVTLEVQAESGRKIGKIIPLRKDVVLHERENLLIER